MEIRLPTCRRVCLTVSTLCNSCKSNSCTLCWCSPEYQARLSYKLWLDFSRYIQRSFDKLPPPPFPPIPPYFFRLLNANKIHCVRANAFQDLQNLSLLSLYDNKIQTLAKGTFTSLRAIQTLWVKHKQIYSLWHMFSPLLQNMSQHRSCLLTGVCNYTEMVSWSGKWKLFIYFANTHWKLEIYNLIYCAFHRPLNFFVYYVTVQPQP